MTFSNNVATQNGGAILNAASTKFVIKNSIFWNNGTEIVTLTGAPLIDDSIVKGGCPVKATCNHVVNANPLLQPLAVNNGFTKTMALGAGSLAIDTGDDATCALTDQREVTRPQGPACDMGAYERRQTPLILNSQAANDGWVLESGENSGAGGSMDNLSPFFYVGDDDLDRQYRAILSFDTAALPTGAIITGAKLKLKAESMVGTSPYSSLGDLFIDIRKGAFSNNAALQLGDFATTADAVNFGSVASTPVDGFYTKSWFKNIQPNINPNGLTQLRLHFAQSTDNNMVASALKFYSSNAGSGRPQFIIYYYLP